MNTDHLTAEARKQIALVLAIDLTEIGENEIDAIIQSAIKKATEVITAEREHYKMLVQELGQELRAVQAGEEVLADNAVAIAKAWEKDRAAQAGVGQEWTAHDAREYYQQGGWDKVAYAHNALRGEELAYHRGYDAGWEAHKERSDSIRAAQAGVGQEWEALHRYGESWINFRDSDGQWQQLIDVISDDDQRIFSAFKVLEQSHNATLRGEEGFICPICGYNKTGTGDPWTEDTKLREWIEKVQPTITFDANGCEIYGLAGNFCIGAGKTFIEAITAAMKEKG